MQDASLFLLLGCRNCAREVLEIPGKSAPLSRGTTPHTVNTKGSQCDGTLIDIFTASLRFLKADCRMLPLFAVFFIAFLVKLRGKGLPVVDY